APPQRMHLHAVAGPARDRAIDGVSRGDVEAGQCREPLPFGDSHPQAADAVAPERLDAPQADPEGAPGRAVEMKQQRGRFGGTGVIDSGTAKPDVPAAIYPEIREIVGRWWRCSRLDGEGAPRAAVLAM